MKTVRLVVLLLSATTSLWPATPAARAQAMPTASKGAEIEAFGGYAAGRTDYGPHGNGGFGFGADFTIFPKFPLAPSLELRYTNVSAQDASEHAILTGIRVEHEFPFKYHPYADFLIGKGTIVYHPVPYPDYTADASKAISYGGGLDLEVARHLGVKFDVQAQNWNLGPNGLKGTGDYILRPLTALVGVTYTVPFRPLNRHGDFR